MTRLGWVAFFDMGPSPLVCHRQSGSRIYRLHILESIDHSIRLNDVSGTEAPVSHLTLYL